MKQFVPFLAVGVCGATLASALHIPAGLMIGPMIGVMLLKLAGKAEGKAPWAIGEAGKILLGTFVGATFNRTTLALLGDLLPAVILCTLALIGVALLLAWLLCRWTGLDMATALFGLTPGGLGEMVAVCEENDADAAAVATLQFLRLVTVLIIAPIIVACLSS